MKQQTDCVSKSHLGMRPRRSSCCHGQPFEPNCQRSVQFPPPQSNWPKSLLETAIRAQSWKRELASTAFGFNRRHVGTNSRSNWDPKRGLFAPISGVSLL